MSAWQDILFFDGEDPEALKARFVELSVAWPAHTKYQVAIEVFRGLKEPKMRALQAADVWSEDLEILERIRQRKLKGADKPECTEVDLIRRALAIADDSGTDPKEKIAAIRLAGELQGLVKKSVDIKSDETKRQGLPTFTIAQYAD